jgi:uncharacterized protein (DUF58 family)
MRPLEGTWGPLSRSGLAAVVIGVVAYVAGWQLGWVELMVVAAGCLLALLAAVPFVVSRSRLTLQRTVEPLRVRAGDSATAVLRAVNNHRLPMRGVRVDETVGDHIVPIDIPRLGSGEEHVATYQLPTERRGKMQIGPAVVSRTDPAGLLRRQVAHSSAETLWVHPRWQLVHPLSAGFAKDLEGPTADDSPAGDVAFHTIRPYQLGDDPRHIHWLSSARTGDLMVRHYVDNRRPHLTIVVDPSPDTYADTSGKGEEFELAIEVAASMVISLVRLGLPIAARVGRQWIIGRANPADGERALDRLTTVGVSSEGPLAATVADALRVEPATSVVVIVTTASAQSQTLACITVARRHAKVIVVDVAAAGRDDSGPPRGTLPGARLVRVNTLGDFVSAWNRMAA